MRLMDGILIREIEGDYMAVMTGKAAIQFNGIIKLNAPTAFLMECLQKDVMEVVLVVKLVERYEVTVKRACEDVRTLLDCLREKGLLIEDAQEEEYAEYAEYAE